MSNLWVLDSWLLNLMMKLLLQIKFVSLVFLIWKICCSGGIVSAFEGCCSAVRAELVAVLRGKIGDASSRLLDYSKNSTLTG